MSNTFFIPYKEINTKIQVYLTFKFLKRLFINIQFKLLKQKPGVYITFQNVFCNIKYN